MEKTFTVPARNLQSLVAKLEKLARKANKYGNAPIGYTIGETIVQEITVGYDRFNRPVKSEVDFVEIAVHGDAPKYGDYTFAAKVELMGEENIVHNIANIELDPRFRTMVNHCDHCGHNRVRNDVFVFVDGSGNQLAVGRTCLKDFTGCQNPQEITNRAEFFSIVEESCNDELKEYIGGYGKFYYGMNQFMQTVAANIRQYGWMSKANADYELGKIPTVNRAQKDILNRDPKYIPAEITDADIELAKETIEYFRTLPPQSTDYMNNLRVILKGLDIDPKHCGLAASAIQVIIRNKEEQIEKNNAEKVSQYYGEINSRYRGIELTFNREIAMGDNGYGEQYMYCFSDNAGNQFTWFTSKKDFEIGNNYKMDFTVKGHREYRGIKQTNITRASIK